MSVKSCEKLEKSKVALTIEVSAEDFEVQQGLSEDARQDEHPRLPPRQGSP